VSDTLSWRRLWLLMRSDAIADYRFVLTATASIAALVFISSLGAQSDAADFYEGWFAALVTVAGPVYTSLSFRELHDKTRNEAYLLLPASSLEKTLARLLRSTVGFVVYLLVLMMLSSVVNEGVKWLVLERTNPLFNPAALATWQAVGVFVVIQSMFFLGAAWFRRMHFLKTWLTLIAIPTVLGCVAIGVLWLFYGHMDLVLEENDVMNIYLAHQDTFDAMAVLGKLLLFVALPVFCWYVAWLRVKETQVSHGV
jgi:hypothetical protein